MKLDKDTWKAEMSKETLGFQQTAYNIYIYSGMLEDDKKGWCDLGLCVQGLHGLHSFVHREVIFLLYGSDEIAP